MEDNLNPAPITTPNPIPVEPKKSRLALLVFIIIILIILISTGGYLFWKYILQDKINPTPAPEGTETLGTIDINKLINPSNPINFLKCSTPIVDSKNKRVYIPNGLAASTIGVIDLTTNELVDVVDFGENARLGQLIMDGNGNLYSFYGFGERGSGKFVCLKLDIENKTTSIPSDKNICQSLLDDPNYGNTRKRSYGNYSFSARAEYDTQTYKGFIPTTDQDLNGAYSKIQILNSNMKSLGQMIHGPDAMFIDIDKTTGKIYASNTGDGSISIFEASKIDSTNYCANDACWTKDIDIGTSIDQILLDSNKNIYIRNRLGGSTIIKYDQKNNKILSEIKNENTVSNRKAITDATQRSQGISMWPTAMALSKDESKLYVLSQYDGCLDVINTSTNKVTNKIYFKGDHIPRTESMSDMVIDYKTNKIFAVYPELAKIFVVDLASEKVANNIDLIKYGFSLKDAYNRGLGLVKLAVDETNAKLFVYLTNEQKLISFSQSGLIKTGEASFRINDQFNSALLNNSQKKELYLEDYIIDSSTLAQKSKLGQQVSIIAFDNSDSSIYAAYSKREGASYYKQTLFKYVDGSPISELAFPGKVMIPSNPFIDLDAKIIYAIDMGGAKINKYKLSSMSAYTEKITSDNSVANSPEASIGFVGCSLSIGAVKGYNKGYSGTKFWSEDSTNYAGTGVITWYNEINSGTNTHWKKLAELIKTYPNTKSIWWELCADAQSANLTIDQAKAVLNKIKSTVGSGVIVYASASPDRPTSSTCTIETSASRANVKSITNSLISQGLVKAGPVMTTLTNAQTGDGCHASTEGECIWGKDLAEFFDQNLETTTCNNNTTQNKDDKKPGTNPCGDGICDETERSSGKCPTDCNK